jgi:hypothetical protein
MAHQDRQSAAFRGAPPEYLEPGNVDDLAGRGLITPVVDAIRGEIITPQEWERAHWDRQRTEPKSPEEAAAAAAARGDDPAPYADHGTA